MAEFDLIERIRRRAASLRRDVVLGIGDDAALLRMPPGHLLVVATDTLNAGVHFPDDTAPADIGWKALAVNLSDLAAMGARPAWCTLSLSLPAANEAWLDRFLDGFLELAALHGVALVGGDTTRGPLSVCVTVHGTLPDGAALRRDGARPGDDVWVSGTLGDAAAALALALGDPSLRARLDRPLPRVALGRALAGLATAAIDVSDGLLADLGHVCRASGMRADVDVALLPTSDALRASCDMAGVLRFAATGGDDYELCFTARPAAAGDILAAAGHAGIVVTRIGTVAAGEGVRASIAGVPWTPPRAGYAHFA